MSRLISPIYQMGHLSRTPDFVMKGNGKNWQLILNVVRLSLQEQGIKPGPKSRAVALAIINKVWKANIVIKNKFHADAIIKSYYDKNLKGKLAQQEDKPIKTAETKRPSYKETLNFYESREWFDLRYQALRLYGRKCMSCGDTPQNGAILHVDHIKPRSKFPELELQLSNLQILCKPCNMGKSNKDCVDYRTSKSCEGERA